MDEEPDPGLTGGEAAEERSLLADIGTLIEDGRTLIQAEIAYQRTRAGYAGRQALYLAIALAFVILLVALALLAAVLGVVLSLAAILTPLSAGFVVAAALCGLALLGLALALWFWRNLRRAFGGEEK